MASGISALNKKEAEEEAAKKVKEAEEKEKSTGKKRKKAAIAVEGVECADEDKEDGEGESGSEEDSTDEEAEEDGYEIGNYLALYAVEGGGGEAPTKAIRKGKWEDNMPLLVGVVHSLENDLDVAHGRGGLEKDGVVLKVDDHTLGVKVCTHPAFSLK